MLGRRDRCVAADWHDRRCGLGAGLGLPVASYEVVTSIGYWYDHAAWVMASTPGLRKVMRDQPDTWPQLNTYLARYDSREQETT
jgi:hypothetical protein